MSLWDPDSVPTSLNILCHLISLLLSFQIHVTSRLMWSLLVCVCVCVCVLPGIFQGQWQGAMWMVAGQGSHGQRRGETQFTSFLSFSNTVNVEWMNGPGVKMSVKWEDAECIVIMLIFQSVSISSFSMMYYLDSSISYCNMDWHFFWQISTTSYRTPLKT